MDFETYEKLVVAAATQILWRHNWFCGVFINNIWTAYPDVSRGVDIAVSDTWHYDGVEE